MLFLSLAVMALAVLTILELRAGDRLSSARLVNGGVFALGVVSGRMLLPFVALSVPVALVDARSLPFVIGFALFFVTMDLGEYAFHRAQHSIPWLWKLHALHHSDPDMNATTAERHFWGDQILKAVTIWPAAAMLIHPTPAIAVSYMLCSLWNYVTHARLPWNFGRFSWGLNSPAYHRRHHSSLPEHYNSNFAALLPIWDVLLRSYRVPSKEMPPTGLDICPANVGEALVWPIRRAMR